MDDHTLVRAGLVRVLELHPQLRVVGEAVDAPTALSTIRTLKPTVALIDLELGRSSGLDLLTSLRAAQVQTRALVVTMYDDTVHVERALKAGARGLLSKDIDPEALHAAVFKVASGELVVPHAFMQHALTQLVTPAPSKDPRSTLTAREADVLRLLGQGCETREIADALNVSTKTVETHRLNLKAKLGFTSLGELIRFAVESRALDRSGKS